MNILFPQMFFNNYQFHAWLQIFSQDMQLVAKKLQNVGTSLKFLSQGRHLHIRTITVEYQWLKTYICVCITIMTMSTVVQPDTIDKSGGRRRDEFKKLFAVVLLSSAPRASALCIDFRVSAQSSFFFNSFFVRVRVSKLFRLVCFVFRWRIFGVRASDQSSARNLLVSFLYFRTTATGFAIDSIPRCGLHVHATAILTTIVGHISVFYQLP